MNKREIEKIVNNKDWTVRMLNAIVYDNCLDLLVALSKDEISQVRHIVAGNENTPSEVLKTLANDVDEDVKTIAKETLKKVGSIV